MGEYLNQVPENIQPHIKEITRMSGLPDNEESIELIAQGWLDKKEAFEEETNKANMDEVDIMELEDERGGIAMTYSGSLVNIGPLNDGVRKCSYASIGLRKDVPDLISNDESVLDSDIQVDEPIIFGKGPVQQTSAIFKIFVCNEELPTEDQEEQLNQTTIALMDDFVEVNKTIIE